MVLFKIAKAYFGPAKLIRFAPFFLIIPIFLFQALSLSGCVSTSPGLPGLYVVSLRPAKVSDATRDVQVRLGYYGICATVDSDKFLCQTSSGANADVVATNLFPTFQNNAAGPKTGNGNASTTTLPEVHDLIATALDLQAQIFMSILAGASFLFLVGLGFLFMYKRDLARPNPDKPRRSAIIKRGTYGMLFLSTALVFTASLATTETTGALAFAANPNRSSSPTILIKEGVALQVLQWMSFGFSLLFTLAVPFLARQKRVPASSEKEEI
ncbi:Ca2+ regulator and membrane fusion protein Fig1-domain-containing protein [Podospora didyma]|uniref:Ca2+ regulator and membrane fusion protein Fig1-domain-containing protein n=1 Tax=Podospora didyma TaxID=330526 RepID=A0AAE0KJF4_9PEZI|nr:Ca2+ regulator and membrane fusion protein Fig1-domain-containing protein [Podospora didyma]